MASVLGAAVAAGNRGGFPRRIGLILCGLEVDMPPLRRPKSFLAGFARTPVSGPALFAVGAAGGLALAALAGAFSAVSASRDAAPAEASGALTALRFDAGPAVPASRNAALSEFQAAAPPAPSGRPRIAIVIDDLGLTEEADARIRRLPGALTVAVLPYGPRARAQALAASAAGREVIVHIPLEPAGEETAGPGALRTDHDSARLRRLVEAHLAAVPGAVGANGHMGSRFTADRGAMRILIGEIDRRGLFFLDSRTTAATAAPAAALDVGASILTRDVFLDDDPAEEAVRAQLRALEEIARQDGSAIAIGHPRPQTIAALGPWMATAPARGFDLVLLSELEREGATGPALLAATSVPDLR
ncbi:MAG: divergent polysaccharide deacetylase family protein [Pseudomonadota bacterium]